MKQQNSQGKPTTIHERIKELRNKNRLCQYGAARIFHVSSSTWSRIESGDQELSQGLLIAICEKWHVSADYILFGEKDTENQIDLEGVPFSQIPHIKAIVDGLRHL